MMTTHLGARAFRVETARFTIDSLEIGAYTLTRTYAFEPVANTGDWNAEKLSKGASFACGNYSLEAREVKNGICLRASFTNTADEPVKIFTFRFTGRWPTPISRCVRFGSEDSPFKLYNNMGSPVETIAMLPQTHVSGCDLMPFRDDNGVCGVLGFATNFTYFSDLKLSQNGSFSAMQNVEARAIEPGETITTDWFYLGCGDTPDAALSDYADTLAFMSGVKDLPAEVPTGWCTWYYYLGNLDQGDVREGLSFLADHKEELPVRYVQIDDGWFINWGEWEENEKFSDGMKKLADEIRAEGFIPGIWLCPFSANKGSKLFREHPELLIGKPDGSGPVSIANGGSLFAIDPTNPVMEEKMRKLYHRLTYDWGYGYIKMDYMISGNVAGVHYDKRATTVSSMRRGLEIIRESVKPGTFLLACSSPLAPPIGLVDGMRTSCDIFHNWNSVKECFLRNLKRYFYHKKVWINDPDCILVRNHEHEDEKCMRLCTRTDDEIRVFLTVTAATGGIVMLSDKLPLLTDERISWLSALFPVPPRAAVPLDYFDTDCPGILDFGEVNGARIVALVNWEDEACTMTVPAACIDGEKHVFEFWTQENLGTVSGALSTVIPAHAARIFYFEDAPRQSSKSIIPAE
ncbi:MAG: alpha-galactosidase [Ruminococcaceae bacterium]|nr:alpha-galactosidase [Oscillospiraceae bacterium]